MKSAFQITLCILIAIVLSDSIRGEIFTSQAMAQAERSQKSSGEKEKNAPEKDTVSAEEEQESLKRQQLYEAISLKLLVSQLNQMLVPLGASSHKDGDTPATKTGQAAEGSNKKPSNDVDKLQAAGGTRKWTSMEIVLSVAVILFGLIIMGIQTYLMVNLKLEWTPTSILRFHGLTMIITAGLLILTASYSQEQMAPVLGLLGTIAGYLLGTSDSQKIQPASPAPPSAPSPEPPTVPEEGSSGSAKATRKRKS